MFKIPHIPHLTERQRETIGTVSWYIFTILYVMFLVYLYNSPELARTLFGG